MSDVLFNLENKVLTITFNRPDKLNAIGSTVTPVAIERIREAVTDPAVGAIVLTGAGRAFCAGGDVSQMGGQDDGSDSRPVSFEERVTTQRESHALPFLLHDIPKVTIAAVNGHAVGAGLGIAASCDLRLSSEKGKFGTAFANVGFGGDFGTTWQLTRLLGESKAKELFFLPNIIDAQEARRIGLVNQVLPEENFMGQVQEIAERIANGPLISFQWMKENINMSSLVDFKTMLDKEAVSHLRCGQTEDHKEGVAAFMEKRQANFKGR